MSAHWADDPANDIDWNNYAAGFEAGRRGDKLDLTGHGRPFCDGYHDGAAERHNT